MRTRFASRRETSSGVASNPPVLVRLVGDPPSAFITKISWLPMRVVSNAILVPSGDHDGARSSAGSFVTSTGFDPSEPITQMSLVPPLALTKAIFVPSGENVGEVSDWAGRFVNRVWLAPLRP